MSERNLPKAITNNPPDSPINTDGTEHFDAPPELTRQIEDRQRFIEAVRLEVDKYTEATRWFFAMQVASLGFFACGSYFAQRGYRYCDPFASPIRKYTTNEVACRVLNLPCMIGIVVCATSLAQLPGDYREFSHFSAMRNNAIQTLTDQKNQRDELVKKWKNHLTPRLRQTAGLE